MGDVKSAKETPLESALLNFFRHIDVATADELKMIEHQVLLRIAIRRQMSENLG